MNLDKIVENKKEDKDTYITSITSIEVTYEAQMIKGESISDTLLDLINFHSSDCQIRETEDTYTICGITMLKEQIPSVSLDRCKEIKAEDNKVVISEGSYYSYTDEQGESHVMSCSHNRLKRPHSETLKGNIDKESRRRASFWNMLSNGSPYIGLYYSSDEEKQILNEAGITEGFFTVQVGSKKGEYFFAKGKYVHGAIPKWSYDSGYAMIMKRFEEYDVGAVFKIGGEEYILDENKKLNVPYGVDIFDIEYPPKSEKV